MNIQNDIYSARQLRLMVICKSGKNNGQAVGAIDFLILSRFIVVPGGDPYKKEIQGTGYASDALEVLIHYAFTVLNLRQLFSNMTPENTASVSLFEKFGFIRCGIKKDW